MHNEATFSDDADEQRRARFHEQDLRMSVWKSRSVAKKAGLYMEEWLTALRSFHS